MEVYRVMEVKLHSGPQY